VSGERRCAWARWTARFPRARRSRPRLWLAAIPAWCVGTLSAPCAAQGPATCATTASAPVCTELPRSAELDAALRRALDDPHGFCKNPDQDLGAQDEALCGLAEAAAPRCPGFAAACSVRSRTIRLPQPNRSAVSLLGSAITVTFWALLALGAFVLLRSLVSWFMRRVRDSDQPKKSEADLPARVSGPASPPSSQAPEALLSQARELAARGAFEQAMSRALAALLRALEVSGALELRASRTNGEYLRQLHSNRPLCEDFRRVTGAVEAVEFGGQKASQGSFTELMERVSRVVGSVATLVLIVGSGLCGGCGAVSPPRGGMASTCGTGAAGYSALCEILGTKGATVRKRFRRVATIGADVRQIVVVEDVLDVPEQRVLREWAAAGGTLVVMANFDRYVPGLKVHGAGDRCQGDLERVVQPEGSEPCTCPAGRLPGVAVFDSSGGGEARACCGGLPVAVRTRVGTGAVVAMSDPRLVTNAALAIEHNGMLVGELLAPAGSAVELIGSWTSSASGLPVSAVIRAGLLPWLLHAALLCVAFALFRGAPFGTRRDIGLPARRAFVEHVHALGDAYARAHASRLILAHYGSWALDRLRIRVSASGQAKMSELATAVAARLSLTEGQVMRLIVAVRASADEAHDSSDESEHLAVIRELSSLVGKAGRQS
jgi:hypothetical protein